MESYVFDIDIDEIFFLWIVIIQSFEPGHQCEIQPIRGLHGLGFGGLETKRNKGENVF